MCAGLKIAKKNPVFFEYTGTGVKTKFKRLSKGEVQNSPKWKNWTPAHMKVGDQKGRDLKKIAKGTTDSRVELISKVPHKS